MFTKCVHILSFCIYDKFSTIFELGIYRLFLYILIKTIRLVKMIENLIKKALHKFLISQLKNILLLTKSI